MPNPYFQFKQFTVYHDRCAMKVSTDACLFGAWCAAEIQGGSEGKTLLDIGTGSGLLSLMIAQKNEVTVDAVEIDSEAAAQALENCSASPWKSRIRVIQADINGFSPAAAYDIIISNPPFYENEIPSDEPSKNLAHHGAGLQLSRLFPFIREYLAGDGLFFLLLPYKRIRETEKLLQQNQLHIHKKLVVRQTAAHLPFRIMLMGSSRYTEPENSVLVIKEGTEYSDAFKSLLRDYYLYL